jgi:hypothetical protein
MKAADLNEALSIVNRLSERDKQRLFIKLKMERLENLLGGIRKRAKGLKITDEEITAEVEAVRQARYEKKKKGQSSH